MGNKTFDKEENPIKKIRFIVDSDLKNTGLIGMSVNKICSQIPFSSIESCRIELCVVEAVNNSIIHAYNGDKRRKVEVGLSLFKDRLILDVIDTGSPLDPDRLKKANLAMFDNLADIDSVPENGRGLAVIKDVMDSTTYKTTGGKNRLRMIKKIAS